MSRYPMPAEPDSQPPRQLAISIAIIAVSLALFAGVATILATPSPGDPSTVQVVSPPIVIPSAGDSTPTPAGVIDGDGTYTVGVDVAPGTYRSSGATGPARVCYWARLNSTDRDRLASVLDDGLSRGRQTVTVKPTDLAFKTSGCKTWTRA